MTQPLAPPRTLAPPMPLPPPTAAENRAPNPGRGPAAPRGRAAVLAALAALAIVGVSLAFGFGPVGTVVAVFVLVVPFEKLFPRHREQRVRRHQVGTDIAYALGAPALGALGVVVAVFVGIATLAWIPGLAISPLVALLPGWLQFAAGVLLFDLAVYWVHRWSHEVEFFWRFHKIHHSTEQLDWVSGFRVHPFDGAILAPPFVFLLAAGFSAELTGALVVVQIVTGLFLHANVRWQWRPLQKLVATPEFHHWHHANYPETWHTNYSGFLPVWDLVFGTYFMPRHRRPQRYGVDEPIPVGMVPQVLYPMRGTWSVVRHPLRLAKQVVRDIWRTSRRPTRNVLR